MVEQISDDDGCQNDGKNGKNCLSSLFTNKKQLFWITMCYDKSAFND